MESNHDVRGKGPVQGCMQSPMHFLARSGTSLIHASIMRLGPRMLLHRAAHAGTKSKIKRRETILRRIVIDIYIRYIPTYDTMSTLYQRGYTVAVRPVDEEPIGSTNMNK